MYLISVTTHFDAAHHLPGYDGPCGNVHGHRWEVKACWQTNEIDEKTGMCFDFKDLKNVLNKAVEDFDHADLNKFDQNPTAENTVKNIYEWLQQHNFGDKLQWVMLAESPGCEVTYGLER